ncbi:MULTISPECIES: hypothetical protein [Halorussus]|uniref:hypothetical protein n=1 Tax=Halorussus TaxID=1070314 RepID=UPI00209F7D9B|nr:hypothetical protein [Halorussus vallis]USZ77643.1 hypothetical protein NGM07_09970 [Halorussus vallis]
MCHPRDDWERTASRATDEANVDDETDDGRPALPARAKDRLVAGARALVSGRSDAATDTDEAGERRERPILDADPTEADLRTEREDDSDDEDAESEKGEVVPADD